jgi:hypothetical protein
MDDEFPLRFAVDQAWTVHLSAHKDVNAADSRRCSLERYLRGKWPLFFTHTAPCSM